VTLACAPSSHSLLAKHNQKKKRRKKKKKKKRVSLAPFSRPSPPLQISNHIMFSPLIWDLDSAVFFVIIFLFFFIINFLSYFIISFSFLFSPFQQGRRVQPASAATCGHGGVAVHRRAAV
jgi:hypothetical protein